DDVTRAQVVSPSSHPPAEGGGRKAGAISLWFRGLVLRHGKVGPLITRIRLGPRRRDSVSRDRYRAIARSAGVRGPARPRWVDAALAVALAVAALIALPRAAAAVGSGFEQLVTQVQSAIPLLQGRGSIELPAGGSSSVGAAPIADTLPAYTRDPQLKITGKVPSFAVQEGRSLQVVLNGAVVTTTPLDPSGAFNATVALKDGANSIALALIADRDVVAASSYTVVLDRTPPTVTVTPDKPTVKPGQGVLATIYVVGVTGPRPGIPITLSVGVVPIGTAVTDGTGTARMGFAAPSTEGDVSVVVLGAGSSGRASLT